MPLVTTVMHPVMYGGIEAGLLTLLNYVYRLSKRVKNQEQTKKRGCNEFAAPFFVLSGMSDTPSLGYAGII